jgi:hypothetical protein
MKTSIFPARRIASALISAVVLTTLLPSEGWTQEKRTVSYKSQAANSKFTQQLALDVGDIPGHQVRVYEHHRAYPSNPPIFNGVAVSEIWNRAFSDYTNLNGPAWGYSIYLLQNGEKIFGRYQGTTQTSVGPDGSRKTLFSGVITLTGGTGQFRGIRGLIKTTSAFDPKANVSETQDEGEYWLE